MRARDFFRDVYKNLLLHLWKTFSC